MLRARKKTPREIRVAKKKKSKGDQMPTTREKKTLEFEGVSVGQQLGRRKGVWLGAGRERNQIWKGEREGPIEGAA